MQLPINAKGIFLYEAIQVSTSAAVVYSAESPPTQPLAKEVEPPCASS
ncbi:MAG: hypothetical protein P8123_07700 [bacterium]